MEKQNPFRDIEFTQKKVPEELKDIIIQNVEAIKPLIDSIDNDDTIAREAISSLFKTDVIL